MDEVAQACGDDLADTAVLLVQSLQGSRVEGLSRAELCDRMLAAVSKWWQVTDPSITERVWDE